jgi:alpha-L-glutamate ligase-like protein
VLGLIRRLNEAGVVGINRRNAEYVLPHNRRRYYPLVDDKLLTKDLAVKAGLAVPALYAVFEQEHEIRDLHARLESYEDFVIKPAGGSGGDGIVVITGRTGSSYRKASGAIVKPEELSYHLANILNGMFTLGGHRDRALVEYRVRPDPVFGAISYQGVPDIRIVVFLGVPAMAMVRLPTRASDGKANLHQGAIGAGIDIANGHTLTAVWYNDVITHHPDTVAPVSGVVIPHWERLLLLAAQAGVMCPLGYFGIDFVLDAEHGPMVLELNARPGLNIQIANRAGLRPRLKQIEAAASTLKTAEERVAFARARFGAVG